MRPFREYGRYGSVGIELVLSVLIGLWLGGKGDARFHTKPWLTLLGLVVGAYAGFRALFRVAKHLSTDIERAERKDRGEDPWWDEKPGGGPKGPPKP